MRKLLFCLIFFLVCIASNAQTFKIIANNTAKRNAITDTIKSGDFIVGVNQYGGGYITQIDIPGIGNVMGFQAQRYGRGGQSSIRDLARGGQYNPTQAGYSDLVGTECKVTKSPGKIVVDPRGCALYNSDGNFDYARWENIRKDPFDDDGGNSDVDGVDEENLSVTIDGRTFTKQEAEVHSDFDFYGDYENYQTKANLSISAVRHYFEYRFIRSSTLPNACMKQFNKAALTSIGKWDVSKLPSDISTAHPEGKYPGGIDNLNSISLAWSIRTDVDIWDPAFRYIQTINGQWQIAARGDKPFRGADDKYKPRFIIAESNDENSGNALGLYRPDSHVNIFNVVGVRESDGSVVYEDNRLVSSYLNDSRHRTPTMSWMGFKNEVKGLIDRSKLTGRYDGVYEKVRNEYILLYGTPAEIKAAFNELDNYYSIGTSLKPTGNEQQQSFIMFPNPAKGEVNIELNGMVSHVDIYNNLGLKVYSATSAKDKISIPVSEIGESGMYFLKVNDTTKKLIIKHN